MALAKAISVGMMGSIGLSFIMHGQDGRTGDLLAIHRFAHDGMALHWSWPIFCAAVGLAWPLLKMTEKA